ncbi:MAG TPA: glycosyltransferase family 2 protein, partial [Chloroflexota bacterium]
MKLLIAIPAYNEEESIQSTIARSLDARARIVAQSPVTDVEVTVVSDGSTDRTAELARQFENVIKLIEFTSNRGYGAAIQAAWKGSDADILGFLDADGTCDPNFFSDLCNTIETEKADVVLGCRMNPQSEMPLVRRIGNAIFALILRIFSSSRVRDTASGMRVVRRESLGKLLPLPDGMHFTPAMSARALLGDGLRIREIDMPYHERQGESKLKIGKDGLRFLKVILEATFLYRPSRPLGLMGLVCLAGAVGLMILPTVYYLQNQSVAEWMIYRFVVSHLAGTSACLLLAASYLTGRMVAITVS